MKEISRKVANAKGEFYGSAMMNFTSRCLPERVRGRGDSYLKLKVSERLTELID
jgi:hypothetical protein